MRKRVNINRAWKPIIVCGCSHGVYIDNRVSNELLKFKDDYKPKVTVHLGDFMDTTCWRSGARGTDDESMSIEEDWTAAVLFLSKLRPNLVFDGNHDVRPNKFLNHKDARIAAAANDCVKSKRGLFKKLKAEYVEDYDIRKSWRTIGGMAFTHGWAYGQNAIRVHMNEAQGSACIAHIHRMETIGGNALGSPIGHSVGLLADIDRLTYAHGRDATLGWRNGWLYGEYTDNETRLHQYNAHLGNSIPRAVCA